MYSLASRFDVQTNCAPFKGLIWKKFEYFSGAQQLFWDCWKCIEKWMIDFFNLFYVSWECDCCHGNTIIILLDCNLQNQTMAGCCCSTLSNTLIRIETLFTDFMDFCDYLWESLDFNFQSWSVDSYGQTNPCILHFHIFSTYCCFLNEAVQKN